MRELYAMPRCACHVLIPKPNYPCHNRRRRALDDSRVVRDGQPRANLEDLFTSFLLASAATTLVRIQLPQGSIIKRTTYLFNSLPLRSVGIYACICYLHMYRARSDGDKKAHTPPRENVEHVCVAWSYMYISTAYI